MSNRTLIELNHDFGGTIWRDPDGFVQAIQTIINQGVNKNTDTTALERFGVTVFPTCHHSEKRRIILGTHTDVSL